MQSIYPEQLPEPWANLNLDFDSITDAFQDMRYIGQLRERGREIKKLQVNFYGKNYDLKRSR